MLVYRSCSYSCVCRMVWQTPSPSFVSSLDVVTKVRYKKKLEPTNGIETFAGCDMEPSAPLAEATDSCL